MYVASPPPQAMEKIRSGRRARAASHAPQLLTAPAVTPETM